VLAVDALDVLYAKGSVNFDDINFVDFCPQLTQLNCVQKAFIGNRISLSTFDRGHYC